MLATLMYVLQRKRFSSFLYKWEEDETGMLFFSTESFPMVLVARFTANRFLAGCLSSGLCCVREFHGQRCYYFIL